MVASLKSTDESYKSLYNSYNEKLQEQEEYLEG